MPKLMICEDQGSYALLDVGVKDGRVWTWQWGGADTLGGALELCREHGRIADLTEESNENIKRWIREGRD